jgi:outer membrane lipoprotein carrier protein
MKLAWVGALFLGVMLVAAEARAVTEAERVASRVEVLYGSADTFRARFTQTVRHRLHGDTKVRTGTLAAAHGGRVSFRYAKPSGDRVVANGKTLVIYEAAARRAYEIRMKRAQHALAVVFLSGSARLTRDFKLRLLDKKGARVKRGYVLLATPKRPTPELAEMVLYIDAATAQVKRVLVVDAQRNTNRFDFTDRRFGDDLPDGEFKLNLPKGTRVVKP